MCEEGLRLVPYVDAGGAAIGYGRNLQKGITVEEALYLLDNDIKEAREQCTLYIQGYDTLSPARQEVLVNMMFNLGAANMMKFEIMLLAVERGDFDLAADEMLDSKWAEQVKGRALKLADQMRRGEW